MAVVTSASYRVVDHAAPSRAADPLIAGVARQVLGEAVGRTPSRTGRLRAGWAMTKQRDAHYLIGNPVRYARFVEHGTRYMSARPMIGPAVLAARGRYGR